MCGAVNGFLYGIIWHKYDRAVAADFSLAHPFPAISKAVPWAGVTIGIENPV